MIKPDVSIEEALENPEEWIPVGCYCYQYNDDECVCDMLDGEEYKPREISCYLCPFWSRDDDGVCMQDGYCSYLDKGDMDFDDEGCALLLWDMCKACGINDDDDDDWIYGELEL